MVDSSVFPKLATYASLNQNDVVLDVGAGFGFLTCFLAKKVKTVIAVEKDPVIAKVLRDQVEGLTNVSIVEGDLFHVDVPKFNKVVAIPPYYLSSKLVTWLVYHGFDCAALILQQEFAQRLVAEVGSEKYGWLTVVAYRLAETDLLDKIPNWMFYPQPDVDSIVVRLRPRGMAPFAVKEPAFFMRLVRWLFTQRNKTLRNALVPFIRTERKIDRCTAENLTSGILYRDRRVRELTPEDFGVVADALVT